MTVGLVRPRSAWGARPSEPHRGFDSSALLGIAVHYNGPPVSKTAFTAPQSYLRGTQAYHMDDRGWSDIAYNLAVDQTGTLWTLRGLLTESGANGDNDVNHKFGAILGILGGDQEPSAEMIAGIRFGVSVWRKKYPQALKVVGHMDIRVGGTDCPGNLYPYVKRGAFIPGTSTPTERDEWDMDAATMKALGRAISTELVGTVIEGRTETVGKTLAVQNNNVLELLTEQRRTNALLGDLIKALTPGN